MAWYLVKHFVIIDICCSQYSLTSSFRLRAVSQFRSVLLNPHNFCECSIHANEHQDRNATPNY